MSGDVKATEELLYSAIPSFFTKSVDHGASGRIVKKKASSEFATTFLAKHLPKKRIRKNEHEVDVHQSFVLDNAPRKPSCATRQPQEHTFAAAGTRRLSAGKLRRAALFAVPPDLKFDDFLPLHTLWLQYMEDVLRLKSGFDHRSSDLRNNLLKADYHGCLLTVLKSKCPSYVGLEGIVVQETQNAWKIATRDRGIKLIPKKNSVFAFRLNGYEFQLFGNHFTTKPAERSSKKFKAKPSIDL